MLTYREIAFDALEEPPIGFDRSCLWFRRAAPCAKCGGLVYTPRHLSSDTVRGYVCAGCHSKYIRDIPPAAGPATEQLTFNNGNQTT